MTIMIRQGDILLREIDPPQGVETAPAERVVLAEGEITGHAHVVEGSLLTATRGGRMLLGVLHGEISHPDHDPTPRAIPPVWYEVIRQRVYTPAAPRVVGD